jgi:hypothetical protein
MKPEERNHSQNDLDSKIPRVTEKAGNIMCVYNQPGSCCWIVLDGNLSVYIPFELDLDPIECSSDRFMRFIVKNFNKIYWPSIPCYKLFFSALEETLQ